MKTIAELKEYRIVVMTSAAEGFWEMMGPFFASRAVANTLGVAMYDSERTTWFVALNESGRVLGFNAATVGGNTQIQYDYSVADAPTKLAETLFRHRMKHVTREYPKKVVKGTAAPEQEQLYRSAGFREVSRRGKYINFEHKEGD